MNISSLGMPGNQIVTMVCFIKVGLKAQIIEIALSKLGARRKACRTPVKSFSKVGRRVQIGRKKFMKSTPDLIGTWLPLLPLHVGTVMTEALLGLPMFRTDEEEL